MENKWNQLWIEDIDYLKEKLINNHINLFAYTKEEDFNKRIESLKKMIDKLDYEEMKVEISRVIASIKDAHTSLIFPARRFIPLKFYYFNDGVYIINSTKDYESLLFKKVIAIEDMKIEEILEELPSIISFENQYFFKAQSMKYLQVVEVLYGLLIVDDSNKIKITLEDGEHEIIPVSIENLVYTNDKLPLYARKLSENLWFTYLDNEELYIKYNSCRESGNESIHNKIEEIIKFIENNSVEKLTVDLRNNLGGDSTLFEPFINYVKKNNNLNKKENLKVIIGRETFSSALLNAYDFKNNTNAKIVGEPSGGKPNCYGEILKLTLPNSKLLVTYSTKFYKLIEDDLIDSLYPDELIFETIEDYINSI
ncbi:S41 family peptidase [uncultured Clostridium sp.]|uniref:S41 family peptidase n=1 Tax=uncultured Clostridium sp. TaxID=59620 RepID=UPI002586409E|nr:S41 family peptidase [uncultured Clostridium sp.]